MTLLDTSIAILLIRINFTLMKNFPSGKQARLFIHKIPSAYIAWMEFKTSTCLANQKLKIIPISA